MPQPSARVEAPMSDRPFGKLINTLRFVMANPSRTPVLAGKILKRLRGESDRGSAENDTWLADNSLSAEKVARSLDAGLWEEAQAFGEAFDRHAHATLDRIPHRLGGGSHHRFLYWLTRYSRPEVVLETGVAAGWSSRAFLAALESNNRGKLYSSDLPYFRIPQPERYVGILVERALRRRWELELEGDQVNLPRLLSRIKQVDLFHYDSDKMWSGRDFAMKLVGEKLAPKSIVIMDDINNDGWFRAYVTSRKLPFVVLEGRFGIIGDLEAARALPDERARA
jgi:predicted O-methyltransferase YrrM